MSYSRTIIVGAIFWMLTSAASAECDFDKPISGCRATITIDSTSGSKGSYSAEITVKSSAGSCSKVEYYLDNTPQTAIIRSAKLEQESLFGTKPIKKSDISVSRCTKYAELEGSSGSSKQDDSKGWSLTGRWSDNDGVAWDIGEDNGKISGTGTISGEYPRSGGGTFIAVNRLAVSGSRSGTDVTITTKDLEFGSTHTSKFVLVDENTLRMTKGNWVFTRVD